MTASESLTLVGLGLNIIGAIVLWVYGFIQPRMEPQPTMDQTVTFIRTFDEEERETVMRRRRAYRLGGHIGLGLLVLGFVLQAAGVVT